MSNKLQLQFGAQSYVRCVYEYLRHADSQLLNALVDLLDQLICHLLHDQHHLDSRAALPTVAEPSLHRVS